MPIASKPARRAASMYSIAGVFASDVGARPILFMLSTPEHRNDDTRPDLRHPYRMSKIWARIIVAVLRGGQHEQDWSCADIAGEHSSDRIHRRRTSRWLRSDRHALLPFAGPALRVRPGRWRRGSHARGHARARGFRDGVAGGAELLPATAHGPRQHLAVT